MTAPSQQDRRGTDAPALPEQPLWIGTLRRREGWLQHCPYAKTLVARSDYLQCTVAVQIRCKRWGCRHCGERRVKHLAARVAEAKPDKLITLTVWTECWSSPRQGWLNTKDQVPRLIQALRRRGYAMEYLRVLEVTRRGWPHYHLIARCGYIPQALLSDLWCNYTGAPVVDIRKCDSGHKAYWYVVKYLGKQRYCPFTDRRVTWSRNFLPAKKPPPQSNLELGPHEVLEETPADWLKTRNPACRATLWNPDTILIDPPDWVWDPTAPKPPPPLEVPQPGTQRLTQLSLNTDPCQGGAGRSAAPHLLDS